mmetsp:Transcript_27793/g.34335  ORF Transcript_27793/g.34335 Transcript_27793/m.34335 type:complete len:116 (+) Transcript_27793:49-396(+)
MTLPQPSKPTFISAEETDIIIQFTPDPNAQTYKFSWKQHPQSWNDASSKLIHLPSSTSNTTIKAEANDLLPATTYCLIIIPMDADGVEGPPSPELIVDTEAISCAPKSKSCCVVQ